jgi:hypothetical protein
VLLMMLGLGAAIVHNHLRRRCSLLHDQHGGNPPKGTLFRLQLRSPTVCFWSSTFMWLSLVAFLIAGLVVAVVGLCTITSPTPTARVQTQSAQPSSTRSAAASSAPSSPLGKRWP